MTDYRNDSDRDHTMPPPNNTGSDQLPEHPLLAAFKDMARMAVVQKGVKALARIEHGINNRRRWIELRESQISELEQLGAAVLAAYDRGDSSEMNALIKEINSVVSQSEGYSPAEVQAEEVLSEDDDGFMTPMKRVAGRAFKGNRHG